MYVNICWDRYLFLYIEEVIVNKKKLEKFFGGGKMWVEVLKW